MAKNLSQELFPVKSTCKIRLTEPPPCNGTVEEMMSWVMCKTWYSPIKIEKGIILVESFRENIRRALTEYKEVCRR